MGTALRPHELPQRTPLWTEGYLKTLFELKRGLARFEWEGQFKFKRRQGQHSNPQIHKFVPTGSFVPTSVPGKPGGQDMWVRACLCTCTFVQKRTCEPVCARVRVHVCTCVRRASVERYQASLPDTSLYRGLPPIRCRLLRHVRPSSRSRVVRPSR